MIKKAMDWKELVCDALSVEELGAAGPLVCHTVTNQIDKVMQQGKEGVQQGSGKDNVYQAAVSFQNLANQLRAFGCTDPNYTNPNKLQQLFLGAGQIATFDVNNQAKLANAISDFLTNGVAIKSEFPDFVNSTIAYVFKYFIRSGYNLSATIQNLQKLQEKAIDPRYNFYVINVLKGNFQAAIFYDMLMNYGKGDLVAKRDMAELSGLALKMLGEQALDVINVQSFNKDLAMRNAKMFEMRKGLYLWTLDKHRQAIKWESEFLKKTADPTMKAIMSSPAVASIVAIISGLMDAPEAVNAISGGIGEAIKPGGGGR